MVAMVTENGHQNMLKYKTKFGGSTVMFTQANTKKIFKYRIDISKIHKILEYVFTI